MNKHDIKKSLENVKPDEFLETRLSTKLNSAQPKKTKSLPRLTISTAAICGLVLVLSISAGIGLKSFTDNTTKVSLTQNYAHETASVEDSKIPSEVAEILNYAHETASVEDSKIPSEVAEILNSETGEKEIYVQYSVPPIETQVHYHQVLLVNGKDIAPDNYVKFFEIKNYAELPLTAILEEFGATTVWQSETEAIITLNEKNYILDAEKCTLKEENSTVNILTPLYAPGTAGVTDIPMYRTYGDDFIVDNYTLQGALKNLGLYYTVKVDYKTETVIIK
ncbi:MAG: hypothetical protein E7530_06295 [Ruminococcaceae bacterium]|nr:hypothetical protein [Oscillospiraceae bacterium]